MLENDLYARVPATKVDAALAAAKVVIVADHSRTATVDRAHLVLPAASFAEGDGTLVSQEGRAQRFFQVFDPQYLDSSIQIHEGWRWMHALRATLLNKPVDWTQLDHVTSACAEAAPQLAGIVNAAPSAAFRIKGMKLAREPLRYSGRTAMRANISVHEPRTPQDKDTAFAFSMEATRVRPNRASRCRSPGRRAGTPHKPGTSFRTRSVATCVPVTQACA